MKHILAVTILIIIASAFAFGQCSDAEKKALQDFDLAWETAGQHGDRAYLENTFADDFIALPAMTGKTETIDNILRRATRNKANPETADSVISDNYIISCTPNTATILTKRRNASKRGYCRFFRKRWSFPKKNRRINRDNQL